MEERSVVLTIDDLIKRGRPVTAASSLGPGRSASRGKNDRKRRQRLSFSDCQTLGALNHPAVLVGTFVLPSFDIQISMIKCGCFRFSDGSATVCCDVLDFDLEMIGQKVRVLAWNFLPMKCGRNNNPANGGFLEVIRWEYFQECRVNSCRIVGFNAFCLKTGSFHCRDENKNGFGRLIFGVIHSISPVSVVPCSRNQSGSINIAGFLASILVCRCNLCNSKIRRSELNHSIQLNVEDHLFIEKVIVYFCGLASSWHPAMSRCIGDVILLSGLKKKQVFMSPEVSQSMFVPADDLPLHLAVLSRKQVLVPETTGTGDCMSYTGVVTGVYSKGRVAELDNDVMLLLTDQFLMVPHSIRVGAIVTLKHSHLVDPKFPWGKMLILGACYRTTFQVEAFSPLKTGCHSKSCFHSLLQKFIDSLSYAAKLWMLLLVSCLMKKFATILSNEEILGTKTKEGLAQKYASYHLPESAFQFKHGLLVQFCKPDLSFGGNETICSNLRLVPPICDLISYCDATWKNILDDRKKFDSVDKIRYEKSPYFNRKPIERVLQAEEIGVTVIGTLKASASSGRLQLVDATGGIDIILDHPKFGDINKIFEAKEFKLIIEGMPTETESDLDFTLDQPFSCRSMFGYALSQKQIDISVYLSYHPDHEKISRRYSGFFGDENCAKLDRGRFHLLSICHKFPIQRKFAGDSRTLSKAYADALFLPWDLVLTGKYECDPSYKTDSFCTFRALERCCRYKSEHNSAVDCSSCSLDASSGCFSSSNNPGYRFSASNYSQDLPCFAVENGFSDGYYPGTLSPTGEAVSLRRSVLLEFHQDAFSIHAMLKIGHCYVVRHEDSDLPCSVKANAHQAIQPIVFSSGAHISSVSFSPDSDIDSGLANATSYHLGRDVLSDVNIFLPPCAHKVLENAMITIASGDFSAKKSGISNGGSFMTTGCPLPEGNLVTLHGRIVALYHTNADSSHGETFLRKLFSESQDLCVHLLADHGRVQIFCNLSKQAYPVGFRRDVHATFHRILVLGEQNKYMMIPASFISIHDAGCFSRGLTVEHLADDEAAEHFIPSVHIYDALPLLSEPKRIRFHGRVADVYVIIMERSKTTTRIPLACFLIDDGSGICCCWAESERAASLLGLELKEHSGKLSRKSTKSSSINQVLDRHGGVVVKNYEIFSDSPCRGLVFCGGSDAAGISEFEEEILASFIGRAVRLSTTWTVVGRGVDEETAAVLQGRLASPDMKLPPLLNILVTDVYRTDFLSEAREIVGELTAVAGGD